MKREYVVKPVPACPVNNSSENEYVDCLSASSEVKRRVRTSAAMIGLAISISATGSLLAQQGNKAVAAESPIPKPTLISPPTTLEKSAEKAPQLLLQEKSVVKPKLSSNGAKIVETASAQAVNKPHNQRGETPGELSENIKQEKAKAIAASIRRESRPTLLVGQSLKNPPTNSSPKQIQFKQSNIQPQIAAKSELVPAVKQDLQTLPKSATVIQASPTKLSASDVIAVERLEKVAATEPIVRSEKPRHELTDGAYKHLRFHHLTAPRLPLASSKSVATPVPSPEQMTWAAHQNISAENALPAPKITVASSEQPQTTAITSKSVVNPQQPQPVVSHPVMLAASTIPVYRVKAGDTLDELANRYGLSRKELVQANNISNPNLITVNQELIMPGLDAVGGAAEPTTLISQSAPASPVSVQFQPQGSNPTFINGISPTEFNKQLSSPSLVAQRSTQISSSVSGSQFQVTREQMTSIEAQDQSQSDFSRETLKAEVQKLRQVYEAEREKDQEITTVSNSAASLSPVVNPEWAQARQPIQNKQQYSSNTRREDLEVKPFKPLPVQQATPTSSTSRSPIVAATPVEVESYNPMFKTPVGESVAPDLPPLSAPDQYLPDSPARFNGYIWPAKGVLTSGYGRRWGRMHKGIDIAAPVGTPIMAAAPGEVVSAGWNSGGYGNLVKVKHPDGSLTLYAHNNRVLVRQGQQVEQGQQIAEMGSTGFSTGPHLHFEVHPNGTSAANPIAYLPK